MKYIVIFMLMLFSSLVTAGRYPVVTITQANIYYLNDGTGRYEGDYYISQSIQEIGAAADWVPPAGYTVGLGHRHTDGNPGHDVASNGIGMVKADGSKTAGQLAIEAYNRGGSSTTEIVHGGGYPTNECVGYIVAARDGSWSNAVTPGGCDKVPPFTDSCSLQSADVILDHGSMELDKTEGHSVSTNLSVSCTKSAAIVLKLITGKSYIDLIPSGTSQIQINGQQPGGKFNLNPGENTLTITDTLHNITAAGSYSGSTVLMMDYY